MASTSGVAPPPVFGPPAPRWPFKSPSRLSRFHNGGECTSSCNTAFAKHILPVFTSPRARRSGGAVFSCGWGDILPLRRARDSAFGKGGELGTEKPTTDKESGELGAEVASASHDVDNSGGVNPGTGASAGVGAGAAGMDAVDKISLVSGFAHDAITS